jgi:flagellar basal body rod protein FlgG
VIEEEICNMSGDGSFTMSETNKLVRATNYKVWKVKMKTILMKERLWELVTGLLIVTITNASEGGLLQLQQRHLIKGEKV